MDIFLNLINLTNLFKRLSVFQPLPRKTILIQMSNLIFNFRISELEVENDKLKHDYELLRNSIHRGVEQQELYGKAKAAETSKASINLSTFLFQHKI